MSTAPAISAHWSATAICSWRSTRRAAPPDLADHARVGDRHPVEGHGGEPADEVDDSSGRDGDPRGVRGRRGTGWGAVDRGGDQQAVGRGCRLDGRLHPVEHEPTPSPASAVRRVVARPPPGSARHQAATVSPERSPARTGALLGRCPSAPQGGRHHVGRHQRARRDQPAHLLGHQHQVQRPWPEMLPPPSSSGPAASVHPARPRVATSPTGSRRAPSRPTRARSTPGRTSRGTGRWSRRRAPGRR